MRMRSYTVAIAMVLAWPNAGLWAQPASRAFSKKSSSMAFNPQGLVEVHGRRAADQLIDCLKGSEGGAGDNWVYTCIQQLSLTGDPRVAEVLSRYLTTDIPVGPQWQASCRDAAIKGLAALDTPASRKALAAALRNPANQMYHREAVKQCGKLRARECAQAIFEYGQDKKNYYDDTIINLALCSGEHAARLIGQQLASRQHEKLYDYEILALGVAGRAGRELLLEYAGTKRALDRGEAGVNLAWALGRMPDSRRVVPHLRRLMKSSDPIVVYFTALSLAAHGDRGALGLIRQARDMQFRRDEDYAGDGCDSDWGCHRRERIRRAEFLLAIDYAAAALGDLQGVSGLRQASRGTDVAAAMLADVFLLKLGHKQAASRLISRIGKEASRGFTSASTSTMWNESAQDAYRTLVNEIPEQGVEVVLGLATSSHWQVRAIGESLLPTIPPDVRISTLIKLLGQGPYAERVAVRDRLRLAGEVAIGQLIREIPKMDQDGQVLAAMLLGEFDDPAGKSSLQKIVREGHSWQARQMARHSLALRARRPWPPEVRLDDCTSDFNLYGKAEKLPDNPIGAAEIKGSIFLVGGDGIHTYDGYQWRKGQAAGMCDSPVTAVGSVKGRLYLFHEQGMSQGDGEKFSCQGWQYPVVVRLLSDGRDLLLGTRKGLYEFDGKSARLVSGTPDREVTAIARQGKTLWVGYKLPTLQVGVRMYPAVAKVSVPAKLPPVLYRVQGGRFQPVVEPLLAYHGWRIPMDVLALAVGKQDRLYVGCTEGLLEYDGKRWEYIDDRQGYDPYHSVHALQASSDGTIIAMQGPFLDQRDRQGRWHRRSLADQNVAATMIVPQAQSSVLLRSNGDVWLTQGALTQYGYTMMPGVVVRLADPQAPQRKLPPETLVVMAKAGEWRWNNPDTEIVPPNIARLSGKGKPVEVPAAQASIEAAAQDPWDYESVEFQFKLDERPWSEWQKDNGILTPLLGEGQHVLKVRARDASGNVDPTPAVLYFTVHTRELAVVRILDGRFQSVFPSQHRRYERESIGEVEVENRATQPLKLRLNLKVHDLFETPATKTITVPSGAKRKVSLNAPFNDRVLALTGGAEVQAVVEAEFEHEGIRRQVRRTFPMNIHPANAFDWSAPEKLAGFINSADPLVETLGSKVYRAFTKSGGTQVLSMRNLALGAYLFSALHAYGVRYKSDPASPFSRVRPGAEAVIDTVRYPGQTLQQKVGDCDDLVVLYASLLEQVGIRAAVIPVEGHVFMMFDSGVLTSNRQAFRVPADLLVERGGSLWIPVEVTLLGREGATFDQAWSEGAEAYKSKYKPRAESVIDVREAWSSTPPATMSVAKKPAFGPKVASAGQAEVENLLSGYRQAIVSQAPAGKDFQSMLSRGKLLAKNGFFQEAEKVLLQASKQKSDFQVAYALGVVRAGARQTKTAVASFEQAASLAQDNQQRFQAAIALATTYRTAGELKKARRFCDQALGFNPAARFDSKYSSLVRFLKSSQKTKASSVEGPPPFIQLMLAEM